MKKIVLFLTASVFALSCNRLAENEYEIEGKIDPSLNGKKVILEKMGGYMGYIPVDTVNVQDGKFVFKGTATDPSLHFITVDGIQTGKVTVILEPGAIDIEVDKDSIFKSKQSGTYNNDKLKEYFDEMTNARKKETSFVKKNQDLMRQAYQTKDTVTINRLNKEYKEIGKATEQQSAEFLKKNPKAFINVFIIKQMLQQGNLSNDEIKKLFDSLDPEVKKTKDGKEVADLFKKIDEEEANKANVQAGKAAPAFSAPNPDGKTVSLKESMGKVTIIDFWASWCKPCRMENPNVVAMYNELHPKGLNIIGVSLDKDAAKWKEAIAADKLAWTQVSNLKFWEDPIARQYGVKSIPATFVLDATGKIVATDLRGDELKAKVTELLNK